MFPNNPVLILGISVSTRKLSSICQDDNSTRIGIRACFAQTKRVGHRASKIAWLCDADVWRWNK